MSDLNNLLTKAQQEIEQIADLNLLEKLRVEYLGKNGHITKLMKQLADLTIEEKKEFGQKVNIVKNQILAVISEKKSILHSQALQQKLANEKLDVTLPARNYSSKGKIHPITQAIEELIEIFSSFGFKIAEGPSIEKDWYNFTALNIPEHHPAREMHDTFYLPNNGEESILLRTHTSSIQIREMLKSKPPFRLIAPGRTYRCDSDITHAPMFHQIEGLVIDKNIHMGHLKGMLQDFINAFFEKDNVPIRLRPSFFPFTEPSAEVDIGYKKHNNQTIIGEGDGWLEVLGCGMVHPNVLKNVGIDPDEYQGFAFGVGIERLAMLKYGAPDLREFFEGDVRWLKHFGFEASDIPSLKGGLTR